MTEVMQHVVDAIALGSLYALFALPIALIFGIMGLINFAHGELIMLSGYMIVALAGAPGPAIAAAAIAVAILGALAMERVAFRPIRGASAPTLLVTSFAVSFLLQNLAILTVGATPKAVNLSSTLTNSFEVAGVTLSVLDIVTVVATALLLSGLAIFLSRTSVGAQMRAAAEDFEMARLLGVRADAVIAVAFGISGLLAGVAALLLVAQSGTVSPEIGLQPVLIAFVATVLGGLLSLKGAVIGGYMLGALTIALQAGLPVELRPFRDAFLYGIVLLVLLIRPKGLIVAKAAVQRI